MIRVIVEWLWLRRLRAENPSLFDGALAAREIDAAFADHEAGL